MILLNILCEGQTEDMFARTVLASHLKGHQVRVVSSLIPKAIGRGGLTRYEDAKREILMWMGMWPEGEARFTTMFDLYALPDDFPGYEGAWECSHPYDRVQRLEESLAQDIGPHRFIPYIQLHEFEALLFADIGKLAAPFPESRHREAIARLHKVAGDFESPEHIDDDPDTAPSKRIIADIPEYDLRKDVAGVAAAEAIGLDVIRSKCRHFDDWLTKLEQLPQGGPHGDAQP